MATRKKTTETATATQPKAVEKKATSKKTAEPKTESKATEKTATKKTTAKKTVAKAEVFIEYNGAQVSVDEMIENAKKVVGENKDIKIYVQPENSKAYIAFDDESVAMDVYFCK